MSNVKEILTVEEFNNEINSGVPVLVDFYANWCGPCKMQAPILHEFQEEVGEKVSVIKIDVDQNPSIAKDFGILSIPTLLVFKDGELKEKKVGLSTKAQLSEMLIKYM
jgi:thioredoxin 1